MRILPVLPRRNVPGIINSSARNSHKNSDAAGRIVSGLAVCQSCSDDWQMDGLARHFAETYNEAYRKSSGYYNNPKNYPEPEEW